MYQQQGAGLPVSADQPFAQNFVQQLPGYPQTPMTQGLPYQEVNEVHAALINAIQAGVQKSNVRIFMFNLLSDQGYNNQLYADILDASLEYYTVLKQMRTQGAAQMAAEETLKAEIPLVVERYPGLYGYMNQQQQSDLQALYQLRDQIAATIAQSHGGGYPQQGGYQQPGYGPGPSGPGHMPGRNVAPGPVAPYRGGPAPMQPHGGAPMGHPMAGGYQAGPAMRPGAHHAPMRPTPVAQGPGQARPSRSMLDSGNQQAPSSSGPSRGAGANRSPVVSAGPVSTTQVFNEDQDAMKRVSSTDRELAHFSDVHAATQQEVPSSYAPAIDRPVAFVGKRYVPARRSDQRIVMTEDGGEKTYTIIEGNDMNYADHEHNPSMVKLSRDSKAGPKVGVPTDWAKCSIPSEVDAEDEKIDLEVDEPVALKERIEAYTLEQGRVDAQRKLIAKGLADNSERVVECYLHLRTPILSNKEEYKILTEKLESVGNLTQLVDGLISIKDDISPTLWYEIHDKLTCIINRRLKAGLGLYDWDVDSITEDYAETLEALAEEFQIVAIDRFKDNTYVAMRKALITTFSDHTNILHLVDDVSITAVPWSSDDIDLILDAEYAMLSAGANKHFFAAAERVFKRTNVKGLSMNRRYFVTADNVWIELHVGDLTSETLLISKVDRC